MTVDPTPEPAAFAARARRVPTAAIIAVLAAAILAAVGGVLGHTLTQSYDGAIADARRETVNTARLLAEHSSQVLGRVESILTGIVRNLAIPASPVWTEPRTMELRLANQLVADGPVGSIAIIDPRGALVARAGRPGAPVADLSARDYFRAHRDGSPDHLYVGSPFVSPYTAREILPVSRRIVAQDGTFLGVALVTIDPGYFRRFYDSLSVGDGGLLALIHDDGTPVVIAPNRAAAELNGDGAVRRLLAALPAGRAGQLERAAAPGHDAQVLAFRRVAGMPLTAIAAQSRANVLADWYAGAWWYSAAAVLVVATIAALLLALLRHVARIERAEAALRMSQQAVTAAEQRLRDAINALNDGFLLWDADDRLVLFNDAIGVLDSAKANLLSPGARYADVLRARVALGQVCAAQGREDAYVEERLQQHRSPDGRPLEQCLSDGRWIELRELRTREGGVVSIRRDITAQKNREAEIERQRALLETAFASIEQGICIYDGAMRLVAANARYSAIRGLPPELAEPGRPIEDSVRFSAARGDYGPGDVETIVADQMRRLAARRRERIAVALPDGRTVEIQRAPMPNGYLVATYSDVTVERQHEAEIERQNTLLAEQAALLASTLKSVRQGISVFDRELRLVAWNDRFIELLQFPREFGAAGRPFADFIRYNAERGEYGPGDVEQQVAERVALARDPKPHQFLRTRPDGMVLDVQGDVSPTGYLVTTYGDITVHKAHEAEIERQRAELAQKTGLLEATLSSIDQGLCVFDADDRLVAWNRRFLELRDYPAEFGTPGRPVEDFVRFSAARGDYGPAGDEAAIARARSRLSVKGRDRSTLAMPNGTILDVQRTAMPNGFHVATYSDVTVQKQTEAEIERQRAELARKNEHLELTLNHMAQGIAMIAPDRSVVVSNSKIAEMLGLPPALLESQPRLDDILARQREGGEFAQGPSESGVIEQLSRIIDEPYEYQRRRPNGLVLEVANTPLPGGGAVRTYTDITARKAAEDALRASEERLQQQVQELQDAQARLTRQGAELEATVEKLAAARDAAQAASLAKSDFLTNMSHEIRTPMNGILGNAHLLLGSPLSAEQAEWTTTIRECGDALLGLINDILDLSKLEAGRVQLEQIDFDLGKTIAAAVGLLRVKAREKNIALVQDVSPEIDGMVRGDPTRLRQVLINLVGNAVKFTEKGFVRIVARPLDRAADGATVEIFVIDSGIGMSEAARERLFEKFSQADSSITRRYGGTGLGLAISKQLVELMGGEIGVESHAGVGSTFRFTLRLGRAAGPASAPAAAPRALPAPAPRALSVLLAEDNPINRRLATTLLERLGHGVTVATNGVEAVMAVRSARYDVVLMDVQMPELDGIEATRLIREEEGRSGRRTPIVALTAHAMQGARESYLAAGMDDYLTKPIDPALLAQCIARWGAAGRADGARGAAPAPDAAPGAADDLDTAQIAAIESALDPEDVRTLVASFLASAAERVGRIAAMADAADLPTLQREAHDLVGTAGNFGARRVQFLARDLESACRDGRAADVRRLIGEIGAAASSAARAMRERFLAA